MEDFTLTIDSDSDSAERDVQEDGNVTIDPGFTFTLENSVPFEDVTENLRETPV
jgi:hypothetical protein